MERKNFLNEFLFIFFFLELFNEDAFSKMKPNSILVNIGRGGMVDQNALVKALENKQIRVSKVFNLSPLQFDFLGRLITFY